MKKHHTSIMGSDKVITMGETINPAHKEIIRTLTQVIIRINLP